MEKELVDVILNVFNKVFHIQFDDKKEILASSGSIMLSQISKMKSISGLRLQETMCHF